MNPSSIALQGLEQASAQLDAAASAIAQSGAPSGAGVAVVSLSSEMVALTTAQTQFEASVTTLQTADQMQQSLFDVMA